MQSLHHQRHEIFVVCSFCTGRFGRLAALDVVFARVRLALGLCLRLASL
jgi:hypothetical protein